MLKIFTKKLKLLIRMFKITKVRMIVLKEIKRCLDEGYWRKEYLEELMKSIDPLKEHWTCLDNIYKDN